jgi:exosortase/archaeosortase family protein
VNSAFERRPASFERRNLTPQLRAETPKANCLDFICGSSDLPEPKPQVSLTLTSNSNLRSRLATREGRLTVFQFSLLVMLLTLAAIAADQFAAPVLFTSSPLWTVVVCAALVWRRGTRGLDREEKAADLQFTFSRIVVFISAHILLVIVTRLLYSAVTPAAGTLSIAGWIVALLKLSVLLPTLVLLPGSKWKILARVYAAEFVAGLVVLFTFFPSRIIASIWPWYGQFLGRLVFLFSGLFVHGLTYNSALSPTISGPDLDVTVLLACSGISGIELFDYLIAFVAFLDWNRLRKGRTLAAYFLGIAAMFLGNALRIASFVIFGNRGFAEAVSRFHLSAGWLFFSIVFLVYLSLTYRKLLVTSR